MYAKMTNSDLIAVAREKAHPSDNPSTENADLIDELIVRIRTLQGRVRRWESAASLIHNPRGFTTPEDLERKLLKYED